MKAETRARAAPALLLLEEFAALKVSGEDRIDFLQGQLSQDMAAATPSRAAPAAWCNRQGRVLCVMVAVEWGDAIFLVLPAEMAEICLSGLSRYILRAKVRMERWPERGGGSAPAPGADRTETQPLAGIFGCAGIEGLGRDAWTCSGDESYCAIRLPGAVERALLLGEPPAHFNKAPDSGWTAENWQLADIRAELPWVGGKTSGKFLAHSLNLDLSGAVSFSKGCYVGQEIIARMEYRGRPKRRMQRVRIPAGLAVETGERLELPGQGPATVIAWASSGDGGIEALAEMRVEQDHA